MSHPSGLLGDCNPPDTRCREPGQYSALGRMGYVMYRAGTALLRCTPESYVAAVERPLRRVPARPHARLSSDVGVATATIPSEQTAAKGGIDDGC